MNPFTVHGTNSGINPFRILELAIRRHVNETSPPGYTHDYAAMWGCIAPLLEDLARDNKAIADYFLQLADEFMYTREHRAEEILFNADNGAKS